MVLLCWAPSIIHPTDCFRAVCLLCRRGTTAADRWTGRALPVVAGLTCGIAPRQQDAQGRTIHTLRWSASNRQTRPAMAASPSSVASTLLVKVWLPIQPGFSGWTRFEPRWIMVRCRPANVEEIRRKIRRQEYEYPMHAADQSVRRHVAHPSDKYGPSCLVLGYTKAGRPLHIECTHPARTRIKIITVYAPDSAEWVDFISRRGASHEL
jgi:hypothetical protein